MTSIQQLWRRYSNVLLWCAVGISAYLAAYRVSAGFWRLAFWNGRKRAIDLRFRMRETHAWFEGFPVYGRIETADYPPAAYPTLWPFVGWASEDTVRWVWALTMLAMLVWLAILLVRQSGARKRPEILLIALLPFATYATYDAFRTGQLILHTLPPLLTALLLLSRPNASVARDASASALLITTLTKPTLTVPFFWTAFFKPRRVRPVLMILGGYAALTLFAASFQKPGIVELLRRWLGQSGKVAPEYTAANLHYWLSDSPLEPFILPVALVLLIALGAWTYYRRDADTWVLAGVAAVVARVWMYHRPFDDFLIVVPLIALWRCARYGVQEGLRVRAGVVAAALWASLLLPRQTLSDYPILGVAAMHIAQPLLWLVAVIILAYAAAPGRLNPPDVAMHAAR